MNIKFSCQYRDGANYKQPNEIIFANPNLIALEEIQKIIKSSLIDECWFIAKQWNVPDIHFKKYTWDSEIDHD